MTTNLPTRLDRVIESLPGAYPGPGGAIAVLREGEVLVRHAWGWANAEGRIAFTPATLFRICSITKQFTCATALDLFPDPSVLDGDVRARLPRLEEETPGALHLCHNQSGLRDYWAVAMLHGSPATSPFGQAEADRVIAGTRTLQFSPGTRSSYCNQNFRILSDILEARTGRTFAELLRTRVFDRAGMEGALLAAETRALPDGTVGYEGSPADGFRPAENRILWTGDAGMGASLDDMIAWERHIDAAREDERGLYRRLSAPVRFADGSPARYGYGLGRGTALRREVTGHGGGLRGWRSHRLYSQGERVSVVVLFNHMANAYDAALDLFAAALDEDRPPRAIASAAPSWLGAYVEPETGLATRIDAAEHGQVRLRFSGSPELLDIQPDGEAKSEGVRLRPRGGALWMDRKHDNQSSLLRPCAGSASRDIIGGYRSDELDAELTIAEAGGTLYGAFSGFLGRGRMDQLEALGPDVWLLPCQRALDFTPPGDWTLAFRRGEGAPTNVEVGCWLARRISYDRVG